jgi:hypothetical protein
MSTWIPGVGYMTFSRSWTPELELPESITPVAPVPEPVVVVLVEPAVEVLPVDAAVAFLLATLTPDAVLVKDVEAMAERASIKPRTLRRARVKAKVQTYKRGGQWWLKLPDDEDGPVKGGRIPARLRRRKSIADPLA